MADITNKPRFHTCEEAEEYAANIEGNYAYHVGFYNYNVKGGFYFVTDRMTDFNNERTTYVTSI